MVGIPGSSKGCNTCRRRKKGCDFQHPSCGQCIKSHLICGGYTRPMKIVSYQSNLPTRAAPNAISKRQTSSSPECDYGALLEAFHVNDHRVFQSQVLAKFWENHIPAESTIAGSTLQLSTITGWLQLASIVPETQVLNFALGALGYARLHLLYPADESLRQNGMVLYQRSLWEIKENLRLFGEKKKKRLEYEFVNACALLGIYEMISKKTSSDRSSTGKVGWVTHTKGVISTMQLAFGPLAWVEGRAHIQFKAMRLNGVLLAFHEGKSTFLNSKEWKTLPWSIHPKTLNDKLVDLMATVPSLIEATRALQLPFPDLQDPDLLLKAQNLIADCAQLEVDLQDWESQILDLAFTTDPTIRFPSDLLANPLTFPLNLLGLVHCIKLYYATCLIVYTTHHQLSLFFAPFLSPLPSYSDPLFDPPAFLDHPTDDLHPSPYFRQILQILPYFFRPELKSVGVTNTTFAINVCFRYLNTYGSTQTGMEDVERLKSVLESLPASGMVAGFIGALGEVWPHFLHPSRVGGREV